MRDNLILVVSLEDLDKTVKMAKESGNNKKIMIINHYIGVLPKKLEIMIHSI